MRPRCLQRPDGAAAAQAAAFQALAPRLETERLVLRAPRIDDVDVWTELMTSPDAAAWGGPMSTESAWEDFCVYVAGWMLHGHGLWSVERDGRLIGFVLLGLEWTDHEPELGFLFTADARGQGFGEEAARAARDHATDLLGAGRFVSYVDAGNHAASRLAQRLGATRDRDAETMFDDDAFVWRYGERRA